MRKVLLAACALCLGVGGAGAANLKIAFTIHSSPSNTFWQAVKKGFDDACAKVQADCQMIFVSKPGDTQGQIANIEAAIAQKPDMIITSITDNKAYDGVVKEAIDAGIPVVASRIGGIPELVEDGRNGLLFRAGDASDLARVLERLIREPGLLATLETVRTAVRSITEDVRAVRSLYEAHLAVRQSAPPARLRTGLPG